MAKKTVKTVKTVARRKSATVTTAPTVSPIFETQENIEARELEADQALLFVNGTPMGTVDTRGQKLGAFAVAMASERGIRTFSLYVDGQKADTSMSDTPLRGVKKIEIVAKDARG